MEKSNFYKLKKLKIWKKKYIFVKFTPKRSAPKCTTPKRPQQYGPCHKVVYL